jgi:hypothetical protein
MPPPTTVTTAGYWGSTYWSKGYWGADYWKQRVPVPTPTPSGGGGSSANSGGYRGFVNSCGILKITKLMARPIPKLLFTREDLETLPRKKVLSPDRETIYELKRKVAELRKQLQEGKLTIEEVCLQVKCLREELEVVSGELAGVREAASASPAARGLWWWTGSAIVGLATLFLIPSNFSIMKFVGYSSSAVLAIAGVSAALAPPDLPPPSTRRSGIIRGLGIIRP